MSRAEDIFQKLIYFGEDAIDDFIVNLQTEELFLDFKQAVSTGKNGTSLHKDDRKNLAKGISGFGNSEGGVIVWGVECSRDCDIGDVAKLAGERHFRLHHSEPQSRAQSYYQR